MVKNKAFYDYPNMDTVRDCINYICNKIPDSIAYTIKIKNGKDVEFKNITFKESRENINYLGTAFYKKGFKGKRIDICGKNRYEWTLTYMSILCGDMYAVPLDKGLKEEELESSLIRSKAEVFVYDDTIKDMVINIRKNGKTQIKTYVNMDKSDLDDSIDKLLEYGKKEFEKDKSYLDYKIDPDEIRIILFTSGTTALSKAVQLTNRNIAYDMCAMKLVEDFGEGDTNLALLPFHHTFGSTGFLVMYVAGVRTVFPDGLRYIAQNLKEYEVSVFVGVPLLNESIMKKINKEIAKQGKTKLIIFMKKLSVIMPRKLRRIVFKKIIDSLGGHLRLIVNGAAGIEKDIIKSFDAFGIVLVNGYGLTETSPVLAAESPRRRRLGSCGLPMIGTDIKIVDKNELGIGEIIAKGPQVMPGYYENEEANKEVFDENGYFHTGDIGYIDLDGFLYITGRKKNVIVLKNGKNVFPEEIEFVVNKIPEIDESMVFGYEETEDDKDPVVSVLVKLDKEELEENHKDKSKEEIEKLVWEKIKEVNQLLPTYKYIKNMIILEDDFIKTTTAKIKRNEMMKVIHEKYEDKLRHHNKENIEEM